MKYTLAALAAATIVVAQLDQIPVCARSCVPIEDGKINGKCVLLDTDCICKDSSFISDISCCVAEGCGSKEEKDAILAFANKICGVGSDLPDDIDATCEKSKSGGGGSPSPTASGGGGDDDASATESPTGTSPSAANSSPADGAAASLGGAGLVGAIVAAVFAL